MSAKTAVYLKCDYPCCPVSRLSALRDSLDTARQKAAKWGWYSEGEQDFCPQHVPVSLSQICADLGLPRPEAER